MCTSKGRAIFCYCLGVCVRARECYDTVDVGLIQRVVGVCAIIVNKVTAESSK